MGAPPLLAGWPPARSPAPAQTGQGGKSGACLTQSALQHIHSSCRQQAGMHMHRGSQVSSSNLSHSAQHTHCQQPPLSQRHLIQHFLRPLVGPALLHYQVVELQRCGVEPLIEPGMPKDVLQKTQRLGLAGRGTGGTSGSPNISRQLYQLGHRKAEEERRPPMHSTTPNPARPPPRTCSVGRSLGSDTRMRLMRSRTPSLHRGGGGGQGHRSGRSERAGWCPEAQTSLHTHAYCAPRPRPKYTPHPPLTSTPSSACPLGRRCLTPNHTPTPASTLTYTHTNPAHLSGLSSGKA